MRVYTIGFTKKTAKLFFELLEKNGVKKIIDIRHSNKGQLAGFTKSPDFEYFLGLHGIEYVHDASLAPTDELRKRYTDKKSKMTFDEYTVVFMNTLKQRQAIPKLQEQDLDQVCFLCSEEKPDKCHRRLVVESIKANRPDVEIIHL
jgi:uncharacterized protein (DUF488 family)